MSDRPQHCTCYECAHTYGFLGAEPHPGICPACGSRAVSFSGQVELVDSDDVDGDERDEVADLGLVNVVHVWGRDATDRPLSWHIDLIGTCQQPTLRHVRIGDRRVLPRAECWSDDLVPDVVRDAVREETGSELVVPTSE